MTGNDAAAFVAEIDERVEGFRGEIRKRAAAAKADLAAGVMDLRSQAGPRAPAGGSPAAYEEPSFEDLDAFPGLAEPSNGSHPLDAPIFSDPDSFLSDDLDFSIDLDETLPN
jgi:hypothetical protein